MQINIISFGQLSEIVGNQTLKNSNINTTENLISYLNETYPQLSEMKYKLAINKVIIQNDQVLYDGDSIAIMPPFSGG